MTSPARPPYRRRAWILGVVVPVLITVAAWAVIIPLLPRLPEPAALHWGLGGTADRTGSVTEMLVTMGAVSGISVAVMAVLAVRTGRQSFTRRMVLGLAVALATMFAGTSLATVLVQVDATSASEVAAPDGWLALSIVLSVALGAVAAGLAGSDPPQPATGHLAADATTADVPEGTRAVWLKGVAALGERTTWLLVAVVVLGAAAVWLLTRTLTVPLVLVPVAALVLTMTAWQVQVDPRGLTARGMFGRPRIHVPAGEVERAEVTTVAPLREFGGWGLRTNASGTLGVVIRKGEAMLVHRSGDRRLVVTVDDAASGAALLNTFAHRARAESTS